MVNFPRVIRPKAVEVADGAVEGIVLERAIHVTELGGGFPWSMAIVLGNGVAGPLDASVLPYHPIVPNVVGLHEFFRRVESRAVRIERDPMRTL